MKDISELFKRAAAKSTCRNARIAAVITTGDSEPVLGWNGPPSRAGEHSDCLLGGAITPENIRRCPSVHAEVRAICRAAELGVPVAGGTLYLNQWFPCAPCAVAIIEAGIRRLVVAEEIDYGKDDCYNFRLARRYLLRAGVEIVVSGSSAGQSISSRRQRAR